MITYPVSSNSRFTFKLGEDVRRGRQWPRADLGPLVGAEPGLIILEESLAALPNFDPATQRLDDGVWIDDHVNQTAIFTRSVVTLTAEELAALALESDLAAKRLLVKNAITSLRQWAIDARAVTVTSGNAVATLQALITRQATFYDRFADLLQVQRFDR